MPVGLKFQRKHLALGYKIKYFYYCVAKRNILQKRVSYGDKNFEKTVYLIKPDYQDGVEGLLSLIYKQVLYINEAHKKGYIPYVDWKNYRTQYYDGKNNAWEFFFEQPSTIREEDVYQSKNVCLSGWTFRNINPKGLFEAKIFFNEEIQRKSSELLKKYLVVNDEVDQIVKKEAQMLNISECIGVYVRGTDYVKMKPSGEYVQPSVEQVENKVTEYIRKYDAPIFLVTEDGEIYDAMKQKFGERLRIVSFDTYVRNYDGKDVLSKSDVLDKDKKMRGQKYLAKMLLLSQCKYLISSITQGSKFSYTMNDGKYQDEYIFDLGLYP